MQTYKKLIQVFDVITSIIIFSGIFLSQYENENYYYVNLQNRNIIIHVINNFLNGITTDFKTYFENYTYSSKL